MIEPVTLHSFSDRSFYSAHFMEVEIWTPYVREVCGQHNFDFQRVSPGVPGTFPTFFVELKAQNNQQASRSIVVKFFGPLFEGSKSFSIEQGLVRWINRQSLPIPSPAILAEGQVDVDWWYLVFEYVPGLSIGQAREQLSRDDWVRVACQMGEYVHQLHASGIPRLPDIADIIQPAWDGYASYLSRQRLTCFANHQEWNDLFPHLIDQLEDFVLPVEQLIDFSATPHMIHADLTADHLLGRMVGNRWQTLAVIDWGDAMTGNLLYELVALHLDLFRADKQLLKIFLEAYNLPIFFQQDFPRKAFSVVLLHQFPMPAYVYAPHQDVNTLQELAERLFGA